MKQLWRPTLESVEEEAEDLVFYLRRRSFDSQEEGLEPLEIERLISYARHSAAQTVDGDGSPLGIPELRCPPGFHRVPLGTLKARGGSSLLNERVKHTILSQRWKNNDRILCLAAAR